MAIHFLNSLTDDTLDKTVIKGRYGDKDKFKRPSISEMVAVAFSASVMSLFMREPDGTPL